MRCHARHDPYLFNLLLSRICLVKNSRVRHTNRTRGIYPGYYPRTSASSVGHLYPYPELLEVLNDIHTQTRNFCEFCTPVPQHQELLEVLKDFRTRTRSFWKFYKNPVPLPSSSVSSVSLWHNTPDTGIVYTLVTIPGVAGTDCKFCKLGSSAS